MDVNSSKDMVRGDMLSLAAIGSSEVSEASPDSLKNTPSNIAKLEDVIEHCEGRQKYLAQTRSPSDGGDVRWKWLEHRPNNAQVSGSSRRKNAKRKNTHIVRSIPSRLAHSSTSTP